MNQALRIDQIVSSIQAALQAFAQGLSPAGTVSIARDPFNVLELLAANPSGYRLILHWAGDENVSELPFVPLLRHKIEVVFGSNLGLTAKPDLALVQQIGDRPALFAQVDNLRSLLLGLQFANDTTGGFLEYAGAEPLIIPDGVPLAAYTLKFGLRAVPAQPQNTTQL